MAEADHGNAYTIPLHITENPSDSPDTVSPMERHTTLLLAVWREVCKHVELAESLERTFPPIARRVPVERIVIRRLDLARSMLETIASTDASGQTRSEQSRTALQSAEAEDLLAWCRRSQAVRVGPRGAKPASLSAVLPGARQDLIVGSLNGSDGHAALLILVLKPGAVMTQDHISICQSLLDPFTIALENDLRVHEMRSLREAAEADKRTLLTRLGRQDISDTIVGAEAGLRDVIERVDQVATSDVPVLLLGETGSGKEVVARAVHNRSRRAAKPFLRVNCGAIPPELIDSELFGHERGSFTGAESQRLGWFERADGGTLFLDEVGELPPAAQVRLLRVLQDGTFERVGGERQLHADVRIIAATHRDLQAMVADGRFRQDLWYRIAIFPVRLPPLRDRLGDIPALATHFALKAARRFGTSPIAPSPEDISLLLQYGWPGNIRELSSVIERAVILGNGRSLEIATSLGVGRSPGAAPSPQQSPSIQHAATHSLLTGSPSSPLASHATTEATLDSAMIRHINDALAKCHGRIEGPFGAAKVLGINPHTLRSRMRKLGIEWASYRSRSR